MPASLVTHILQVQVSVPMFHVSIMFDFMNYQSLSVPSECEPSMDQSTPFKVI